jgi:hypothetical protein
MVTSRLARLHKPLLRWVCWVIALFALVYLCNYLMDARMRRQKAPSCEWDITPSPDNLPYSVRFCYLNKETVLLRLYDSTGKQLLAERTYFQLDRPRISWDTDRLWYDTYPDDSFITLPPSFFERLRARLP